MGTEERPRPDHTTDEAVAAYARQLLGPLPGSGGVGVYGSANSRMRARPELAKVADAFELIACGDWAGFAQRAGEPAPPASAITTPDTVAARVDTNTWLPKAGRAMQGASQEFSYDLLANDRLDILRCANAAAFRRGDRASQPPQEWLQQFMLHSYWYAQAAAELAVAAMLDPVDGATWDINFGLESLGITVVPMLAPDFADAKLRVRLPFQRRVDPERERVILVVGVQPGHDPAATFCGGRTAVAGDVWAFQPTRATILGWMPAACFRKLPVATAQASWSEVNRQVHVCSLCDLLPPDMLQLRWRDQTTPACVAQCDEKCALPLPNQQSVTIGRGIEGGLQPPSPGWRWAKKGDKGLDGEPIEAKIAAFKERWDSSFKLMRNAWKLRAPEYAATADQAKRDRSERLKEHRRLTR